MRIRAHHLLCLSTFRGEGYSPEFVANMQAVFEWSRQGGVAELVAEEDLICEACPLKGDCQAGVRDRRLLKATGWQAGERIVVAERVRALIPEREKWVRSVCWGCPWEEKCAEIPATF